MLTRISARKAGVSLLEVLVANAVLLIAVLSIYAMHAQSIKTLKRTNEASAAQSFLLSQLDQLRDCTWLQLTGSAALPSSILPDPTTDANLKKLPKVNKQSLTVYPALTASTSILTSGSYFIISRSGTSITFPSSFPPEPYSQSALTFVINLQWTSQGKTFTREYAQVISKSKSL